MALKFSIRSGALPSNSVVAGFRGSEGLSRPYVFDIYINVPGETEVALDEVIGSKGTLAIADGMFEVAHWGGIFASFELVRAIKGNALYLARLVPQLWQLSMTRHSRMFTKKTAPNVIKAVLDEEGILDFDMKAGGSYPEEEHVCQYRESSLDFIHRWAEREGIYYFFEQTDEGERVVFVDDKGKHEAVKSGSVRYHPTTGKDMSAGRHFENFVARHATLPATVKLGDYDYAKPALEVSGSSAVLSSGFGEIRQYGNRFFSPGEGARVANLRAEELRARGTTYHAVGAAAGLYPGYTFTLEEHPHGGLNKAYLTTQIEHFGYVAEVASAWGDLVVRFSDDTYRVDLTAISADLQYRHASTTPWPRIDGFENGIVDGPANSEYAQIDDAGRYQVKFKFDEGTLKDGKASTYVRMMQPHGGAVEGFHFPLRKGTEVVFIFMGGDPDRPVIAGVVPNAQKPSPVVASNHTQNIIQTGGANYITIEDLSGSQFINIFCPVFETNLYLGCDRPEGSFGLTSGKGPNAVEQGEYKEELGAFNFQLYTKKNGEIFTKGNLNEIAYGKYQLEGQTGVIQYSGDYWRQHVKGETEEHRLLKVHHRYDNAVDYDWKGPYTLDVELASTLHYANTYTRTVDGTTTVSDKSALTHFIGAEANMCGADTHYLKVQGTEKHEVTGKQTEDFGEQEVKIHANQKVEVGGDQEWTTTGKVEWTIGPELKIHVTGPHEIESATWHENVFGRKSEFILGLKHETIVGACIEFMAGIKIEGVGGVLMEAAPLALENEALNHKLTALQSKIVATSMRVGTAALKALASGLETYGAMVGPAGFRMH